MNVLALAFATPLFGFALHVDPAFAAPRQLAFELAAATAAAGAEAPPPITSTISPETPAPSDASTPAATSAPATPALGPSDVAATVLAEPPTLTLTAPAATAGPTNDVAAQLTRRAKIARIHRAFGLATWASMTVTVVLGFLQYYNLYGWFASQGNTPCVTGHPIGLDNNLCIGQPASHAAFAGLTAATYFTTFGLSYAMPDPTHLDRGDSPSARRLRTHKRLRWAHFAGMIGQILLGIVIANNDAFGLDRANHFRALQGLATAHLAMGVATYATLTWAGAIMIRRH